MQELGTRDEVIRFLVERANRNAAGRVWRPEELCWCGSPLDSHLELGCEAFVVITHDEALPPPRPVSEWDPWSLPASWLAL